MKRPFFLKSAATAALALGALGLAQVANAHTDVYFSVGVPAPVYVAPAPVYVRPAPVYIQPRPAYAPPAEVYMRSGPPSFYDYDYGEEQAWRRAQWRHRHHRHHDRHDSNRRGWDD